MVFLSLNSQAATLISSGWGVWAAVKVQPA
jgi:hypothetical protein